MFDFGQWCWVSDWLRINENRSKHKSSNCKTYVARTDVVSKLDILKANHEANTAATKAIEIIENFDEDLIVVEIEQSHHRARQGQEEGDEHQQGDEDLGYGV